MLTTLFLFEKSCILEAIVIALCGPYYSQINRKPYDIAWLKSLIKVKRAKVSLQKHLRIHNLENLEIVAEIKRTLSSKI